MLCRNDIKIKFDYIYIKPAIICGFLFFCVDLKTTVFSDSKQHTTLIIIVSIVIIAYIALFFGKITKKSK